MSIELENPPEDTVSQIAFSPGDAGPFIACSSWDGTVRIWNLNDTLSAAQVYHILREKKQAVLCLCWSPDGRSLYYGTTKGEIKVCNIEKKGQAETLCTVAGPISGIDFWETGSSIIFCTLNGILAGCDANSGDVQYLDKIDSKKIYTSLKIGTNALYVSTVTSEPTKDLSPPENQFLKIDLTKEPKPKPVSERRLNVPIMCFDVGANDIDWIVGYVNGQVEYFTQDDHESKIEKGHRSETGASKQMYSVNCIAMSRERPFCISGGGDTTLHSFNLKNRRTKPSKFGKTPTAMCLSYKQGALAVATGNDYSKGSGSYYVEKESNPTSVIIKKLTQADYA